MCHTGAVCLPGVWLSNERLIKILLPLYGYTVESLELVLALLLWILYHPQQIMKLMFHS